MPADRIQRINSIIREELARSLYRIGIGDPVNRVDISIVSVETTRDLRSAVVLVSFLGAPDTHEALMHWLRRHRTDFQTYIAKTVQLKYTPKLMFRQTDAPEKADKVLAILADLGDEEDSSRKSPTPPQIEGGKSGTNPEN